MNSSALVTTSGAEFLFNGLRRVAQLVSNKMVPTKGNPNVDLLM